MTQRSGAGAATSSGISYQNRVAAYLLASATCETPVPALGGHPIRSIGFETTEKVDDINLEFSDGSAAYLQVKRQLNYSIAAGSELLSVLQQFAEQFGKARPHCSFYLITTSDSSRRITGDLRAALDAFRIGTEANFYRDQPKSHTALIDTLIVVIAPYFESDKEAAARLEAIRLLKAVYVVMFDLEDHSCLQQAIILLLQSKRFGSPELLWGKLVSDCLKHSSLRHTVLIEDAKSGYERFLTPQEQASPETHEAFLKLELREFDFPVGREFVLGLYEGKNPFADQFRGKLALFGFYRFDADCNERLKFEGDKCVLQDGSAIRVLRRTGNMTGMIRMIDSQPDLVRDKDIVIVPLNSDENFEEGLCAERHRALLQSAVLANRSLLNCLHCGKAVSSANSNLVEISRDQELRVGLTHNHCARSIDRLIGSVKSEFFERYDYLRNFDVNAWFQSAQRGQGVFAANEHVASKSVILWSGREAKRPLGDFVVECLLSNGDTESCSHRGQIHRFTKFDAERFALKLSTSATTAAQVGNPLCYSDQSKAFGSRSTLLGTLGLSEELREIKSARAVRFEVAIGARYDFWAHWYAPIAFLRVVEDESIFTLRDIVPLITDPLRLDKLMENWRAAGFSVPDYEVMILRDDREFDDFALQVSQLGVTLFTDPLIGPGAEPTIVGGTPILTTEQFSQAARSASGRAHKISKDRNPTESRKKRGRRKRTRRKR